MPSNSWPTELRRQSGTRQALPSLFDDGDRATMHGAEYLRVESPSAEVRGHGGAKPPPSGARRM